jgi:hypothetical protein
MLLIHIQIFIPLKYLQRRTSLAFHGSHFPSDTTRLCGKLALDERKRLGAVLVNVLLVSVGVVAVAAVWVRSVAVRLDDGGASGRTLEA